MLVVDDNHDNREIYSQYLENHGYRVAVAKNGLEGVSAASEWRPSVVVMDVAMPGIDGWEATRRIRAIRGLKDTFVIAVTSYDDATSRRSSFDAGCDLHLVKPVRPEDLLANVVVGMDAIASRTPKP